MAIDDLKISTRISLAIGAVLTLGIIAVLAGLYLLGEVGELMNHRSGIAHDAALAGRIETTRLVMTAAGVLAFVTGIASIPWLIASTVRPLQEAVLIAETVKSGDLSQEFDSERGGDFGRLLRGLGDMEDTLTEIVTRIRTASDAVMAASEEIAAGNQDLSSRTERQTFALQKTAASMGELTERVRQNAEGAHRAHGLASSTSSLALTGGRVVDEMTETIDAIGAYSRKIVDIVGMIDGIAFQTNILALNAAVEAARAGENGRGFAVVAGEVQGLAKRAGAAAREINGLIEELAIRIEAGSDRVQLTGQTIAEIVSSTALVSEILANISAASAEQNGEIERVNQGIAHLDQVTQQNAVLVEEASAAAAALRRQASGLSTIVGSFKL